MGARILMHTDLLTLAQWLSPSYPLGAFSYSHGLENAIEAGQVRDAASLENWLTGILDYGAGRTDAILLAAAYHADGDELSDIAELGAALCPSRERLKEAMQQGTAFQRVTNEVWGFDLPQAPLPVLVGRAAALKSIDLETCIQYYLHGFISNLVSAATRLMPLGQTDAQRCLANLADLCRDVAADAIMSTLDDIGSCAFAADIASMNHETQSVRLFQS